MQNRHYGCYCVCVCVLRREGTISGHIFWEMSRPSLAETRSPGSSSCSGKDGKSEMGGRGLCGPYPSAPLESFWFGFCFAVFCETF